jgi:hypothetical protein
LYEKELATGAAARLDYSVSAEKVSNGRRGRPAPATGAGQPSAASATPTDAGPNTCVSDKADPSAQLIWRRVLISAEVYLACYAVIVRIIGRHPSGPLLLIGIAAFIAWAFLFYASPFLISTHRRLAIIGWCIAVVALLLTGSVTT